MRCNVGGADRAVRAAVAIGGLIVGLFGRLGAPARLAALAFAGSATFTAFTGYCPLNQALGIDTCERKPILLPDATTGPEPVSLTE